MHLGLTVYIWWEFGQVLSSLCFIFYLCRDVMRINHGRTCAVRRRVTYRRNGKNMKCYTMQRCYAFFFLILILILKCDHLKSWKKQKDNLGWSHHFRGEDAERRSVRAQSHTGGPSAGWNLLILSSCPGPHTVIADGKQSIMGHDQDLQESNSLLAVGGPFPARHLLLDLQTGLRTYASFPGLAC